MALPCRSKQNKKIDTSLPAKFFKLSIVFLPCCFASLYHGVQTFLSQKVMYQACVLSLRVRMSFLTVSRCTLKSRAITPWGIFSIPTVRSSFPFLYVLL